MPIRNLIFDFGGVFLDLDYQATRKAFVNIGFPQYQDLFSQFHASHLFEALETGKMTPQSFYEAIMQQAPTELKVVDIKNAWNAMLGGLPSHKLAWLQQLKGYRLFLFSNTNAIHYEAFQERIANDYPSLHWNGLFEKAWYSHEIGHRKPYVAAFEWVLADADLRPEETLFIDDSQPNIDGAALAGLHTLYFDPAADLAATVENKLAGFLS